MGLEPGLGLEGVELSSQGFQLLRAKLCPPATLSLTPRVDNGSEAQHHASEPISTRLLWPPAPSPLCQGPNMLGQGVEKLLEVGGGLLTDQA